MNTRDFVDEARAELLADISTIPGDIEPESTKAEDSRYVYFVQAVSGGPIKIGVAADPADRLAQLQPGNPERLQIIGVIPDAGRSGESILHLKFQRSRLCGEWFEPISSLLSFIKKMAVPYASPSLRWVLTPPGRNRRRTVPSEDVYSLAEVAEMTNWPERSLRLDCAAHRHEHVRSGERLGMTRQQVVDLVAAHEVRALVPSPTP